MAQAGREARGRGQRGLGRRPSPHLDTRRARIHDTDLLGLPNAPAISRLLSSLDGRVRAGEESERYGFSSRNLYIFFKKQANLGKLGTSPANFSF